MCPLSTLVMSPPPAPHILALPPFPPLLQLQNNCCCSLVQVALLSGLDTDGQKKLNNSKDTDNHLNKLLRLLTVRTESGRDRSGIALVGGPHDSKLDGSATQRYLLQLPLHQLDPECVEHQCRGMRHVQAVCSTNRLCCCL